MLPWQAHHPESPGRQGARAWGGVALTTWPGRTFCMPVVITSPFPGVRC